MVSFFLELYIIIMMMIDKNYNIMKMTMVMMIGMAMMDNYDNYGNDDEDEEE